MISSNPAKPFLQQNDSFSVLDKPDEDTPKEFAAGI